jgi:hypothetical protein
MPRRPSALGLIVRGAAYMVPIGVFCALLILCCRA